MRKKEEHGVGIRSILELFYIIAKDPWDRIWWIIAVEKDSASYGVDNQKKG